MADRTISRHNYKGKCRERFKQKSGLLLRRVWQYTDRLIWQTFFFFSLNYYLQADVFFFWTVPILFKRESVEHIRLFSCRLCLRRIRITFENSPARWASHWFLFFTLIVVKLIRSVIKSTTLARDASHSNLYLVAYKQRIQNYIFPPKKYTSLCGLFWLVDSNHACHNNIISDPTHMHTTTTNIMRHQYIR